jgi:hypothetical protein
MYPKHQHLPPEAIGSAIALLTAWLKQRLTAEAFAWFDTELKALQHQPEHGRWFKALGLAPRKLGKADLVPSADERHAADQLRHGLDPTDWSVDQTARICFTLAFYQADDASFAHQVSLLVDTSEINELLAIFRGFALFPHPQALEPKAREAIRSTMRPVYEAMAHRNPYPLEFFDEAAWNQMIVKAFFLDSSVWQIQGMDQRYNTDLSIMLIKLVQERWAAGRFIAPEIWRGAVPCANSEGVTVILQALGGKASEQEMQAIAKVCMSHPDLCDPSVRAAVKAMSWQVDPAGMAWSDFESASYA